MKIIKVLFTFASATLLATACGGGGGSAGSSGLTPGSGANSQTSAVTYTAAPGQAASISLAKGDKIDPSDPIFYQERFAATVADAKGLPVKGASITLKVEYLYFNKGFISRTDNNGVITVNGWAHVSGGSGVPGVVTCANEDLNKNNSRDAGEDVNGNGRLDPEPSLVTASLEGSTLTDTNGNVKILVRYPKAYASWIGYKLIALVQVTGTEGKAAFDFETGYLAGDEKLSTTPFVVSPLGVNDNCASTL